VIAQLTRGQLTAILSALLLGTLMTSLSQLIITTALPVVIASLGGLELYSWVFASALLASTIVYPIAGKLSDLFGRKRLYLIGMAVFMLGSALCGASQSIEQLICFRALQGIGAGCVQPSVSAMLADLFEAHERARWQGINGAIWGLASVLGPVLGGYLAEHVSWRWVFYVNIAPGLLATVIMLRVLPVVARRAQRPEIDWPGMLLLSGSLASLVLLTLWGGKQAPWLSITTAILLAVALGLFVAFIRHEQVAREPVVPLDLFHDRTYQSNAVMVFLAGLGMFAGTTYVPLYLQGVYGISPTATGLMFLPTIVLTAGLSVLTGFFMARIGYRRLAIGSMLCAALGFGAIALLDPQLGPLPAVFGISLAASSLGLSFPVSLIVAQESASDEHRGVASSMVQLLRSLGGTVGVAALGAYLGARLFDFLGTASVGGRELITLLRPEALATLPPAQVEALRLALAEALRGTFAIAAVGMLVAAGFAFRLGYVAVRPRRRREATVETG
jgi:EmrB/QacA subfamily drug resistance transporter